MRSRPPLVWRQILVRRPLDEDTALEMMGRVVREATHARVVFELRGDENGVRLLIHADIAVAQQIARLWDAALVDISDRTPVRHARTLVVQPGGRAFAPDVLALSAREVYRAISEARAGEAIALQMVVGPRLRGMTSSADSEPASFLDVVLGRPSARSEPLVIEQLRRKHQAPGFAAVVRLGVTADSPDRAGVLMRRLHASLRRLEAPGVRLVLRGGASRSFNEARLPWWWPTRLTVREAAALSGLPIGDDLPGLPPLHPVQLPPPVSTASGANRFILARATAPGYAQPITLGVDAVLRGIHLLGPVGVGKSDTCTQLALQWINQGNAAAVLEPKRDLCDALVAAISPEQRDRVVYFDVLSEDAVIGLNPLRLNGRPPELVVDSLVSIFSSVLSDVIGVTTRDLLNSALLSLCQYPGATLLMLPLLLSDPRFRRKIVANVAGDVFLQAYWAEFEAKSEQARRHLITPVLTRLRALLLRPSFRRCLGQADPKFDVRHIFDGQKKVLLAPLPKAQLGTQGAALLGSLLLHEVFGAVNERAVVPSEKRHPVMVAVDEWHHFIHGTQDFAEALTLFRGYGAGFVLANQVMAQLGKELRDVVTGTVRSRVYFQLGADDAVSLSRHSPELEAIDLMGLEQFHVYAALYEQGKTQPFASGRTIQLPDPLRDASDVRRDSHRRYGVAPAEVDRAVAALYGATDVGAGDEGRPPPTIGRRPRSSDNT